MEEKRAKLQFESLLYGAQSPMVIFKGEEMVVEIFNQSYSDIYHGHDLLGKPLFDAIAELRSSPFPAIVKKVYETGETYISSEGLARILNRKTQEIEERYFDTTFSRIDFGDGVFRILAMPREVTEKVNNKKKLESCIEQLKEEKAWREFFVSTITHDLVNPLSLISIALDSLKNKAHKPAEVIRISQMMKESVKKAKQMTEDLLDVNRLEAGEWPSLQLQWCCIRKICEETVENLEKMYPQRMQVKIPPNAIEGQWDPLAINRIINNLVSNAIQYGNPETKVTIELSSDEFNIYLSVQNWGNPILEEDQSLIFNKYHRVSGHRSALQRRGWGIGLALVKGLSQAQGGNIKLTSSQDLGTSFVVSLPIRNY